MHSQVEQMDHNMARGTGLHPGKLAIYEQVSSRRPGRLAFIVLIEDNLLCAAPFGGHDIDLPKVGRESGHERDLFTVRRPPGRSALEWRERELQALATVTFASP